MYLNRERDSNGRFQKILQRKKLCPTCGKLLWRKDFYKQKGKGVSSDCKECYKAKHRTRHKFKHKDGLFQDDFGRPIEYIHGRKRYYWTPQMLCDLRRLYPTTKNEEIAEIFMMSSATVIRKARSLGIKKDNDWMTKVRKENSFIGGYAHKKNLKLQAK